MSSEWLLKTPTGERNVSFRFTSDYGFGGSCEGFVQPGEITFDGQTQAVQVKRFYRETYDDRGRGFTQDPATEVERSYEWLSRLSRWGFHTLPFFGVLAQNETKMLPMIDLSDSEKFEVHDEKYLHRNAEGEKMLMSLINKKDVFLSFLRSSMLGATYSVDLGNGTAHMLVRDPKTNTGELFVTDVGECELLPSKYKDALPSEILLSGGISAEKTIFDSNLEDTDDDDEMYEEARLAVIEAGKASTSYLQRKLKLGYARAARLIDMLEERGIVGPGDGAKPREVLEKPVDHLTGRASMDGARHDSAESAKPGEFL